MTDSDESVSISGGGSGGVVSECSVIEHHLHLHGVHRAVHGVLGPLGVDGAEVEINVAQGIAS